MGAIIASLLMIIKGWYLADPIVSAVISLIVIYSSYRLIAETAHVILQGVPKHLDSTDINASLLNLDGVGAVHDLHVWCLSSQMIILTVHLVEDESASDLLIRAKNMLKDKYKIEHTTIQIESDSIAHLEPEF